MPRTRKRSPSLATLAGAIAAALEKDQAMLARERQALLVQGKLSAATQQQEAGGLFERQLSLFPSRDTA